MSSPTGARVRNSAPGAFSLVEVTLALGVAVFCLIVICGLIPISLKSNQASIEQTAANGILCAVATDLRATPPTSPAGVATASQQYKIPIPGNPVATGTPATTLYFNGEGKASFSLAGDSRYRLTVTFIPNGPNPASTTMVSVQVSWPAGALIANAAGVANTYLSLDRN